jgi:heterodisulfide reductase subunit C2
MESPIGTLAPGDRTARAFPDKEMVLMNEHKSKAATGHGGSTTGGPLDLIAEKVDACMQCGTCTGSCANAFAMDYTPRQLWRLVQLGLQDEVFSSQSFWICSSCYYCTLRCPRGLPLTEAMQALKRIAFARGSYRNKTSPVFYRTFLDNVRRYGRVREMDMMTRYFLRLKHPIAPLRFVSLGTRLLLKGKISPQIPSFFGKGKLDALFRKVQELEAES